MAIGTHTSPMNLRLADEETDIDLRALQGLWSDESYLKLTNQTNRLIEFTDGIIAVLPMPTDKHHGKYREPDVLLVLDAHDLRRQDEYWLGVEAIGEGRAHPLVVKGREAQVQPAQNQP